MSRKTPVHLLAPVLALTLASSCFIDMNGSSGGPRVTGSGVVGSEVRAAGSFHGIDAGGSERLEIEVGSPQEVVVTSDDNLLEYVETSVRGGVLRVRTRCSYRTREGVTIRVRTPELRSLDLSGSHDAIVTGIDGGRFDLDVSGSVSARVKGRVGELRLDSSGSSDLDLGELVAQRAWLDLSGSSSVLVHVEEVLEIDASGSSSIRYRGRPTLSVDQSGSGSVKRVD